MHGTLRLVVLADDRTGARETAGACADRGCGAVPVVHWSRLADPLEEPDAIGRVVVIDLASRHLALEDAAARITSVLAASPPTPPSSCRFAQKIDSTLRGNWASELVASSAHRRAPTILVPAFPAAGRTCVGGVVLDHGTPVHESATGTDARQPLQSSEPAKHLASAGATGVQPIASAEELRRWLRGRTDGFAVCDAQTDDDLDELATLWAEHPDATFAGTAASIAAAAHALIGRERRTMTPHPTLPLDPPTLIVCGSLHPSARRQIDVLLERFSATSMASNVDVVVSPLATSTPISPESADRAASDLAAAAHNAQQLRQYRSIVVLGGDTAAAFLGDHTMVVQGTLSPGTAWGRRNGAVVITRPGGFGNDDALIELLVAHDGAMPATGPTR